MTLSWRCSAIAGTISWRDDWSGPRRHRRSGTLLPNEPSRRYGRPGGVTRGPRRSRSGRPVAAPTAGGNAHPKRAAIRHEPSLHPQSRGGDPVERNGDGIAVNHLKTLASLGGATLDNEENYLLKKLFTGGLGILPIENQARL